MILRDDEIPNLKVGDVIYECEYATNIEVRLLTAPVEAGKSYEGRRQWQWKAENTQNGQVIDYLLTEGLSHYGPRLYRQPEYVRFLGSGRISIPLIGGPDREVSLTE